MLGKLTGLKSGAPVDVCNFSDCGPKFAKVSRIWAADDESGVCVCWGGA